MKLKSLYIKDYKNIKDQTFDFSSNNGYIALIGENGSGKSNLLEAISLIFKDLYNNEKGIPFDYSITYEIDGVQYERANNTAKRNVAKVSKENIKNPSSVIACYSGEDMRLWHTAYEEYYNNFFNKAKSQNHFVTEMLYVNKYCWKIALLSLLCNSETEAFLRDSLGLDDIEKVDITFTFDDSKREAFSKHDALKWFGRIVGDGKTVNAKTIATTDTNSSSATTQKQKESKTIFQYLYLLSMPEKNATNKVEKLITDISIKIGGINFDDLSEGEKKLILIECITKILGDKDSLLLLDEPDAHTHIARKKELLKAIEKFEGQTIMTTHSPVFVDLIKDSNNIYPIEGGKLVSNEKKALISQISNNELSYLEGALIISSKNILITEGPDDIKHIKAAIEYFASKDCKYCPLNNISIIMQGGAKMVKEYYESILNKLESNLNLIVFVFDYDSEGREGAKMVEDLKENKIKYCYYNNTYPIPPNSLDFYLEDFYSDSIYSDVVLPNINGKPKYYEMKKLGSLTKSVKERIQKKMNNKEIKDSDFDGFKPLLDELLKIYNLQ